MTTEIVSVDSELSKEFEVNVKILYGSEAWCLKESKIGFLHTEGCMVRAVCGVQLSGIKRDNDFMLDLNEAIDEWAMASNMCWYGHVLRRLR